MAYNPPSIVPYNYNANPPPDDGSRTASNRVAWSKVRGSLTDPLRVWMDAINTEVARAFAEVSEFYVPVGAYMEVAWAGAAGGYVGLNMALSSTDYARLSAAITGVWDYVTPAAGTFLTPPYHYYIRPSGVWAVGDIHQHQNAFHLHQVADPGHAHGLPTQWAPTSKDVAGSNLSTIAATPYTGTTDAALTGIVVLGDGGDEARPNTMVLQGMIKA